MKIVIDIPKGLYYSVIDGCAYECNTALQNAFKNGILLPKGHGRLIDESKIDWLGSNGDRFTLEERIKNTSETIVEADKEGAEE